MAPATKKAAKSATKAAPAAAAFEIGQNVKFLGYGDEVPEDQQVLEQDAVYPIVGIDDESGHPFVQLPNPDFDSSKKEDAKKNPTTLEVEVFPEEVEVTDEEATVWEAEAEDTTGAAEEAQAEVEETKPAAKGKAPAKSASKTPAKTATKAAAAKETAKAGKGKAAAAPAKGKGKAAAEADEAANDEMVELENEDPEVLALIEGSEDLIATAQELETNVATTEWNLGGVLRHIQADKVHLEVEGAAEAGYDQPGGFNKFLDDFFNIGYRKAMYLIQIYEKFTLAGIKNPAEVVASLGWTKASKIAPFVANEDFDANELIELASENTAADLSEAIKEQVKTGGSKGTGGESVKRITFRFRLFEEDAASVEAILNTATEQLGLKDIGEALSHIVNEWATVNAGGTADVEDAPAQAAPKKQGAVAKKAVAKRAVKA